MASLGAGNDTFVWNPGDGSDQSTGQAGFDTLVFNGNNNSARHISISANGAGAAFRVPRHVTMDLNSVERIELDALGGADNITINDLTGTDVKEVAIDLGRGRVRSRRTRFHQSTNGQPITVTDHNGVVTVSGGLASTVTISNFESGRRSSRYQWPTALQATVIGRGKQPQHRRHLDGK